MLGDIGGLQQSLYIIGFVIVTFIAKRIFISTLLNHIYQIKDIGGSSLPKKDTNSGKNLESVRIRPDEDDSE